MNLDKIHSVYFLGIGGIGMSALARWFNANGYKVAGYDKTPTDLTNQLIEEGMLVHFEDDVKKIPLAFLDISTTLIVLTPAVPQDHSELNYFIAEGFEIKKRSQVLGMLTEKMFTVAVAGTHGKTTTSSMVAHVLKFAGKNTAAFLGGITQNYNTNLLLNDKNKKDAVVVVEADEYDRSFLTLRPDVAVINSMDPDHLDIYGDEKEFIKTFNDFVKLIKPSGFLIHKYGLPIEAPVADHKHLQFAGEKADYNGVNVRVENSLFCFDIQAPDGLHEGFTLMMPGMHNVNNSIAAFAVGRSMGISVETIKDAIASFKGVKRRFEYHVRNNKVAYIDDYAHHPEELDAFIDGVRAMYPGKKFTLIFQPHLFSRTKDFMDGFAASLAKVDRLLLLDIYPARELPMNGITSSVLLDKIKLMDKTLVTKEALMDFIDSSDIEVLATAGAGDIDRFIQPITELFKKKYV